MNFLEVEEASVLVWGGAELMGRDEKGKEVILSRFSSSRGRGGTRGGEGETSRRYSLVCCDTYGSLKVL